MRAPQREVRGAGGGELAARQRERDRAPDRLGVAVHVPGGQDRVSDVVHHRAAVPGQKPAQPVEELVAHRRDLGAAVELGERRVADDVPHHDGHRHDPDLEHRHPVLGDHRLVGVAQVEDQLVTAELDAVAVAQGDGLAALDPAPVEPRPVGAHVDEVRPAAGLGPQLEVVSRDGGVLEDEPP